jgi:hypothetical protein
MTSVLEEFTSEEQHSVILFCEQIISAKDIHKEIFPIYGAKCLSHRAVHKCVANAHDQRVEMEVKNWLR